MSTCADLREDLALLAEELLPDEEALAVRRHVASCASCAVELDALRAVLSLVRRATDIEPTDADRDALHEAVLTELGAAPVLTHARSGGLFHQAVARYERSARFRRVTLASIGLHAAAAATIAWLLVGGGERGLRPQLDVEWQQQMARLEEDTRRALTDTDALSTRAQPDEVVAGGPAPFEPAAPDGVRLPPVMDPGGLAASGQVVRAPTFGILVRLRAATEPTARARRLSERLGDELAPQAEEAVADGLAWLAAHRGADGRWGPVPRGDGDADVRDGVTGAVLLAFAQNGHSVRSDDAYSELLVPAVRALEHRLANGPAEADDKPVYSHALALRALVWIWARDFRATPRRERERQQRVLAKAARALLAMQDEAGGFGYRPGDRPDASCTLFVTGALADLRLAGVLRPDDALRRAGAYLASLRTGDGLQGYREKGDRARDAALAAGVLAYSRELGVREDLTALRRSVRAALTAGETPDALLAWSGLAALRREDGVADALTPVLRRQRGDGRWPAATDRHCRLGGDDLTTAMGVLAVSRVYMP